MRALSSSLTSSSATNHPRRRKGFICSDESGDFPRGKRSNASDFERTRKRALCGGLCPRSERFSRFLRSFVPLSFSTKREQLCLSLSLLSSVKRYENTRERERGDCDGIPPWCWKSGFDEDEDEDFKGDETKERRGDVDRDDDAPSFLVFALVFVRSRDSTDG